MSNNKKMSKDEKIAYLKKHLLNHTYDELASKLGYKTGESLRKFCNYNGINKKNLQDPEPEKTIEEQVEYDERTNRIRKKANVTNKKYSQALNRIEELETLLETAQHIHKTPQNIIIPKTINEKNDATFVVALSDWHSEEPVLPGTVNGLNEYNLAIADERIRKTFDNTLKLIKKEQRYSKISRGIVALLGDFISGSIHDELMESSSLAPADALLWVQSRIVSGLNFLLKNTDLEFDVICTPGNHGRMTKRIRHSTEPGNSLETLMYKNIAWYFEKEKRLNFVIAEGYHTYYTVFDYTMRFHHGNAIRYYGGVGGVFIPAYKAIMNWNKAKHADLDIMGHFHTLYDGGNFVVNNSLIGYNGYSIGIKASFSMPGQTFISIVKGKGKAGVNPIWAY